MARRRRLLSAILAGAALAPAGCLTTPSITGGTDLDAGIAARAQATGRTRSDLLRQLGPPAAIFARDEEQPVPGMPAWVGENLKGRHGTVRDGGPAFELFRDGAAAAAEDRVYYWYESSTWKWTWFLLLSILETGDNSVEQLWALVDPRTDEVRAIVYLPAR